MNAVVQVNDKGDFPDENFYLAWRGLEMWGYDVRTMDYRQIPRLTARKDRPVYAGVDTFIKMMRLNRIDIINDQLPSYPEELKSFLGREISITTLRKLRAAMREGRKVFVKPLDKERKLFAGGVLDSKSDLIAFSNLPDEWQLYAADLIDPVTEYRVYVCDQEILDIRKYGHEVWGPVPLDRSVVESAIQTLKSPPAAYCMDFCVTKQGQTLLVETTDAWSFGAYGLDAKHYGRMIIKRWQGFF